MPIFLLSDILLWLILLLLAYGIYRIQKDPQSRENWKSIFSRPMAMICSVICCFYLLIALVDSIHFKPPSSSQALSKPVISLLDWLLQDVAENQEITYSAPFSTHLYSKMTVIETGISERVNLPLKRFSKTSQYDSSDAGWLITQQSLYGIFIGLGISLFILSLIHFSTRKWNWKTRKHAYATITIILCLASTLWLLSQYFHVFGTDKIGNDVLISVTKGIRTAILLGTLTTIVLLPLALVTGIGAGFFRGAFDDVVQFVYTTLNSIPGVLLIASSVLLLQVVIDRNDEWFSLQIIRSDARLILLCVILGITSWTGLCRLLRAETLKIRALEYIEAARALGVPTYTLLRRHIMPNLAHVILIVVVLDFSGLVLAEAVLSYVGVGVDPTTPSWGNMINSARMEISKHPPVWWSLGATFVFMFILILSVNLFADAIRQSFDPRQKRSD